MYLLTQFALARRSVIILIMLIIVALGIWSWNNMPNELFPSIETTTIMVVVFMPGSNPDAMVDDVTEELEEVLASLEDVEKIESLSFDTKSLIFSTYYEGTDMDNAENDAVAAVSGVDLPDEALEPIVMLLDPALVPITWLTVTSEKRPIPELQRITNDIIIPAIEKVEGTFLIDLFGAVDEEILVEVDLDKMEDLGVSLLQIGHALVSNNVNIPAGDIDQGGENFVIRTSTEFGSIEDVRNVVVTFEKNARDLLDFDRFGQVIPSVDLPDCEALANIQAIGVNCLDGEERKIRLKDIALVKQGTAKAAAVTRNNGRPGLGISITKKEKASTVEVEAGVLAVLKDLEDVLPPDVEIVPLFSQVPSINAEIESLGSQGRQGFILAVIVVFVFLFNIRSGFRKGVFMAMRPTAVIAASIPISILAGLTLTGMVGQSLNMMTMAGLAIAVGRVVDDSISVLENMFRHIQLGEGSFEAGISAVKEVFTSVIGSTLCTIAVFVPLAVLPGLAGELFTPLAVSMSFALVMSTVTALTVVPVMGSFLLKRDDEAAASALAGNDDSDQDSILQRAYTPTLRWALRHKVLGVGGGVGLMVLSVYLVQFLPQGLFPPGTPIYIELNLELPEGTSVSRSFREVLRVEQVLEEFIRLGYVDNHTVTLGAPFVPIGAAATSTGYNFATFSISLTENFPEDIVGQIRGSLPDVEDITYSVIRRESTPATDDMIITVSGPDFNKVASVGRALEAGLSKIEGIADLTSNNSARRNEVIVTPILEESSEFGLTTSDVALQVATYVNGFPVTEVTFENVEMDIRVRARPEDVDTVDKIKALDIQGLFGRIKLGAIADVGIRQGPAFISRFDENRSVFINGVVIGQDKRGVAAEINQLIATLDIPAGVEIDLGGVFEVLEDSFSLLTNALAIGILLVFLILITMMGTIRNPVTILLTLPLAFFGGIVGLLITGNSLGLPAMMGFMMLVGIVVANAMMLIEFVEELREQGYGVLDALIEGGRLRVRPILMTACTTGIALVPLALGLGGGAGIVGQELGVTVLGGLISSTGLTLLVVPVVYSLFQHEIPALANRIQSVLSPRVIAGPAQVGADD